MIGDTYTPPSDCEYWRADNYVGKAAGSVDGRRTESC
jgi:hypothetical protein